MTEASRQKCDYIIKLVILGDSSVGKTNLLLRFTEDNYRSSHMPTIGVDFKIKHMVVSGKRVKCQLWDTAGQERFRTITETYYKGASGVVLVYSVSDRKSFNSISNWMSQLAQKQDESTPKILVANKCDLGRAERCVSYEQGKVVADKFGATFFQASAKLGTNVSQLFTKLSQQVIEKTVSDQDQCQTSKPISSGKVDLTGRRVANPAKGRNCCPRF